MFVRLFVCLLARGCGIQVWHPGVASRCVASNAMVAMTKMGAKAVKAMKVNKVGLKIKFKVKNCEAGMVKAIVNWCYPSCTPTVSPQS